MTRNNWYNLVNNNSKTSMIKENRLCRNTVDFLLDSVKHGVFARSHDPLTKSNEIFSYDCNFKRCNGKITYQKCYGKDLMDMRTHMGWLCDTCYRESKLQVLETKLTLKTNAEIQKDNSFGNWLEDNQRENLEFIAQQLRNLYRIIVDDIKGEITTDEQVANARQLHKKIHDILYFLRLKFSSMEEHMNPSVMDFESCQVLTLINDEGKVMSFDELNKSLLKSRTKTMYLIDSLIHQFSKANVSLLSLNLIADEPRKRAVQMDKVMEIIK